MMRAQVTKEFDAGAASQMPEIQQLDLSDGKVVHRRTHIFGRLGDIEIAVAVIYYSDLNLLFVPHKPLIK